MSAKVEIKKDNLDYYLMELAKEYRKINKGKVKIEIVLVGGAAVVANYGFRDMTVDIDAIMDKTFGLKDAIFAVAQKHNLNYDWLNSDFMKTSSYSRKLRQYSVYYKTFANCIEVRTIKAEFLIAMKLVAARKYKNDISDIIGIINEHQIHGNSITYDKINKAVVQLYGTWDGISSDVVKLLKSVLKCEEFVDKYLEIRQEEIDNKRIITEIDNDYPNLVKGNNINDIIETAKKKKEE